VRRYTKDHRDICLPPDLLPVVMAYCKANDITFNAFVVAAVRLLAVRLGIVTIEKP
jgi:hypothetical protein